jgi:hypothetical protein
VVVNRHECLQPERQCQAEPETTDGLSVRALL